MYYVEGFDFTFADLANVNLGDSLISRERLWGVGCVILSNMLESDSVERLECLILALA